ncbi:MAG: DUF3683 domain-containing protein [Magnetococcales bacterium]|nr:DUF3683 domain-containing protein [Magnetococcales bacterium]
MSKRIREIPYNYTSFSDREVVIRFLGKRAWAILQELRAHRKSGRSAHMLFEILGDMWIVSRNPMIQDDLFNDDTRQHALVHTLKERVDQIRSRIGQGAEELVTELLTFVDKAVENFASGFIRQKRVREDLLARLSSLTRVDNIGFDPLSRVSHATDATDWRVHYPLVVLFPDTENEVAPLVRACIDLGLSIIPRGGGTGYTGGGIPLSDETVVINTEKLDTIDPVEKINIPGHDQPIPTIRAGAGAVTRKVSEKAAESEMIFAVDPTSQNASTIGGNVAMNAGGKKAVMWGTSLDNLFSWRMVSPDGHVIEVQRMNHNLGKIHSIPEAIFSITRYEVDGKTPVGEPEILTIPAHAIRKPGLGKDVTDKFLGGLPGVQKEGCDGLVTSAIFVTHPKPKYTYTVCMEFFGHDLSKAVPAIVETKDYLDQHPKVGCAGLEHLDDRYIKAIKYSTKSNRGNAPKMVLLADIIGDDAEAVAEAAAHVQYSTQARDGEAFIATDAAGRRRFWSDRSRTAAIAAHTNAFKVNEDVVIPLERLAEYNVGIERLNIEHSIQNKLDILNAIQNFLTPDAVQAILPNRESEEIGVITAKVEQGVNWVSDLHNKWHSILQGLDNPASSFSDHPALAGVAFEPDERILDLLLRRAFRISFREAVIPKLNNLFSGKRWEAVQNKLIEIHQQIRPSRLFIALHMHAGDGNIHTNIPVNSNDYDMLHKAEIIVTKVMALALELGGEISGEHGIGLTKIGFLDAEKITKFAEYKRKVDPNNAFNPGKLMPDSNLEQAYTPSLRLVQQEALILRDSALGDLNDMVRNCLRCGKCKPVCTTHVPRATLLYSPRNKILGLGLMIEAFLYEEQTKRGISHHHFDEMNDVADHCTVCHRCVVPCPVDIDFGKVTIRMREILKKRNERISSAGGKMAMSFLNKTDPRAIRGMRNWLLKPGYAAQRTGHNVARTLGILGKKSLPPQTCGRPPKKDEIIHLLKRPLSRHLPGTTSRSYLNIEDNQIIPLLRDPEITKNTSEQGPVDAAFYFPGCGCERLYSDISLAVMALLHHIKVPTVLPPGYLCCGFPQKASGDLDTAQKIVTGNRVLLYRMAKALDFLKIKTVLVSCGTCMNQLVKYDFEAIFPGCRIMDIHEFLMEKGLTLPEQKDRRYLFHDPCHTPTKQHNPTEVAEKLLNLEQGHVLLSDRCCSEAGTFAVNRPDIATQARYRKEEEIALGKRSLNPDADQSSKAFRKRKTRMLTTCPSCVQGLSRYRYSSGIKAEFLAVEMAKALLGANWQKQFVNQARNGAIDHVLL